MSEEVTDGYHVRRREFLNEDPELTGFIVGIVEDTRSIPDDDPHQRWNSGNIVLDLADCRRKISFYFDMCNRDERANSLRKITLLAEIVNAMRDAIALEVASRNARPVNTSGATTETDPGEEIDLAPEVAVVETAKIEVAAREPGFTSDFVTLGL